MQRTQLRRYSRFRRPFWKACFKCSNPFLPKSYMAYDDPCKKQMNHYTLSMVVNVLSYISSICLSERKKFSHSFMTRLRNCGSFFICLIVHSQTIRHLIPCFFNSSFTAASRLTLSSNFFCQNSSRDFGMYAYLQPSWRCQKHPCIKTAVLYLRKNISGWPGILFSDMR